MIMRELGLGLNMERGLGLNSGCVCGWVSGVRGKGIMNAADSNKTSSQLDA